MLECAYWAQNQSSYEYAEKIIAKVLSLKINDDTLRLVTNEIGRIVFEHDRRRAQEDFARYDRCEIDFDRSRKGVLYIEVDGAALNTRHINAEGSSWRENKLGIVFNSEQIKYHRNARTGEREHHIEAREYVTYLGGVDEFKKHLLSCALKNGYGNFEKVVVLSDGAAWIAKMTSELFFGATHILDFFHLCENVYSYAKELFDFDETRYVPWAERICTMLKLGQSDEVLHELEQLPNNKPKGSVDLPHYICTHKEHIDYPKYIKEGLFIGSGAIESGNKIVLQRRLKQAGMRWEPQTAQYLLTLKSKVESGLWQQEVVPLVKAYYGCK